MNTLRSLTSRMSLRNRRVREKYFLLIIVMAFFFACICMVFFLPDLRARTSAGVQDVYQKIPDLFLAQNFPIPPPAGTYGELKNDVVRESNNALPRPFETPRYAQDRQRLLAKIDEEEEHKKVLEKPQINYFASRELRPSSSSTPKIPPMGGIQNPPNFQPPNQNQPLFRPPNQGASNFEMPNQRAPNIDHPPNVHNLRERQGKELFGGERRHLSNFYGRNLTGGPVVIRGGEDSDKSVRQKRDFIKLMMKDAWDSYKEHAWGHNELRPISERGHSSSIFGSTKIGATIVDAVDTLFIMGLDKEYEEGRDWIATSLDFDSTRAEVSVFETNIRFVGGFLTMYALTGDSMYRDKAYNLAKKLLPAFDTPTGIPYALVSLNSLGSKNYGWASSGSSILSEFGTLHLEFVYLSDITGDPVFRDKVFKIRDVIKRAEKHKGLYFNYFHPKMGKFTQRHVSMGALGDSFYEYLLKSYIQTGDEEGREMYDGAMDAFEKNGLIRYSKSGLVYFAEMMNERVESKMDHLACFAGGLLALGAHTDPRGTNPRDLNNRGSRHMKIAEGITNTCHESYIRTQTRLDAMEARALRQNEKYYILRPEVIESYFVLWRLTGDSKYRDWGWDAAQAIEKYCKAGPGKGYSGLRNVYMAQPQQDDVQQSFFLAETLKYLYLLFSSNDLIDLDQWVFNTEAHPLPIRGVNPYYRAFPDQKIRPSGPT